MSLVKDMEHDALGEDEDPDPFIMRMEQRARELKAHDITYSDKVMKAMILAKLPAKYESLITSLACQKNLSYSDVKDHLRNFYGRVKGAAKEDDAALTAFDGICHECQQYGHKAASCPRKKRFGNHGGRGGRGGRGGGRGRGGRCGRGNGRPKCDHCHKTGHTINNCWARKKESDSANAASEFVVTFMASEEGLGPINETFVLDSGCTTHMVESAGGLLNMKYEPGEVIVANGQKMKSIGYGSLKLKAIDVNGNRVTVTLQRVLVVPEINRRLLSVMRIFSAGGAMFARSSGGFVELNGVKLPIRMTGPLLEIDLQACHDQEEANVAISGDMWHKRSSR